MTTTEVRTNAWGHEATGIPPIECPRWCTDPGHIAETGRADQNCYSPDGYVTASLDEVEISQCGVYQSRIGAMAHRKFNQLPVVLLHVEGFRGGHDSEIFLTAEEARQLATYLHAAADHVTGNQTA